MLAAVGYGSIEELVAAAVPGVDRATGELDLPAAADEAEVLAELRALADRNTAADQHDRPRLLRHGHAAGDPAQHPGEPGLVHGVHAVPARDLAGPAGGAAQLPDDGRGPDRPADSRTPSLLDEGDRGGRGDGAGPPGVEGPGGRAVRRRRRLPAADDRGDPHPGRAAGHRGRRRATCSPTGCPTGESFGAAAAVPGGVRRGAGLRRR